jgi:hypothetical protein
VGRASKRDMGDYSRVQVSEATFLKAHGRWCYYDLIAVMGGGPSRGLSPQHKAKSAAHICRV